MDLIAAIYYTESEYVTHVQFIMLTDYPFYVWGGQVIVDTEVAHAAEVIDFHIEVS